MTRSLLDDVVAIGGGLSVERVVAAYRDGTFPMHITPASGEPALCWWAPDPRAIIRVDDFARNRSLRRACRPFEIRVDTAFDAVVDGCADPRRPYGWINADIRTAYRALHEAGFAHSVEAWHEGELAGGVYGVALGGLVCAESKFHRVGGASKAALCGLVEMMRVAGPGRIVDVQWLTPHLARLGAVEVSRAEYGRIIEEALALSDVEWAAAR